MPFRTWLVAMLTGLLTAAILVGALQVLDPDLLLPRLRPAITYASPALVVLVLLATVRFGPAAWRELKHWAARPFSAVDVLLLSAFGALLTAPRWAAALWHLSAPSWAPFTTLLAWLAGLPELARWTLTGREKLRGPAKALPTTAEGELLDRVVGDNGMQPLFDLDTEDALDRRPFVDTLEAAVRHPRDHSFTFGLDGPWGSGKTTILNALEKRLRAHNAVVVRFDALSFREPERVVGNYLVQFGGALRQAGGTPGLRAQLRRLGLGIAPLAGSRFGDALRNWLSTESADSVRELLDELRAALRTQRQVVVVIVDDLDRLEHDELHAALRTMRLVGDLPCVTHVLAYDRCQVERVLFPNDESGRVARDYLAKIVHVELSLSTPTPEAASRVLREVLQPLLDVVSKDDADRFVERLNSLPRQVFVQAMPTPREVRRVAAATALLWHRLQRDLNLFDLFVLQLIHARFPRIFEALHAHPEWFTEQRWSGDLWRLSEEKRWKAEGEAYATRLWTSQDPDEVNAARLLELIFPSTQQGSAHTPPTEANARRERRICHPEVFPRYLQLSVPREQIAESSIEDLAERVRASEPHVRAALMQQTVEKAAGNGHISALFDQWDIFVERLGPADGRLPYALARDVAVGVALATTALASDSNDPLDPRRTAALRILHLADRAGTNQQVSELLCEVIRECPSFAVSGLLLSYTTTPEQGRRALPERSLDEHMIRGEFDQQVRRRLAQGKNPGSLFDLPDDDVAAVLYKAEQHLVREVFGRALHERPRELPRVLGFAVKLAVNSTDPQDVSVFHDGLAILHQRFDLTNLFRTTEQLATDYWDAPHERALVHYFRTRYQYVVAEAERVRAGGSAPAPPSPTATEESGK